MTAPPPKTGRRTETTPDPHFAESGGSGLCPADGYFSASYGPVTDTTQPGGPAVYFN